MGADPFGPDELEGGEDTQGGGHRGHGAAGQHPGRDAESEGEGGVAERCDAARREQYRPEPLEEEPVAVRDLKRAVHRA